MISVCADKEAYGRAKKEYEACGEVDGPEYEAGFCIFLQGGNSLCCLLREFRWEGTAFDMNRRQISVC